MVLTLIVGYSPLLVALLAVLVALPLIGWCALPVAYRACIRWHGDVWRKTDWWVVVTAVVVGLPFWLGGLLAHAGGRVLVVGGSGVLLSISVLIARRLYRVTAVLLVVSVVGSLLHLIEVPSMTPSTAQMLNNEPHGNPLLFQILLCAAVPCAWLLALAGSIRFDASPPGY